MNYNLDAKRFDTTPKLNRTPNLNRPKSAHASVDATVVIHKNAKETVGASSPTKNVVKKFTPKTYTDNEIKKLLEDYTEIPKASWDTLKINDHIRYFSKDNKFRRGGFIKTIYNKNNKKFFLIGTMIDNRNGQNGITFPVAFEDISKLYKKGKLTAEISQDKKINDLEKEVAELKKQLIELDKRIKIFEKKK
jgi:hypothetical protein